MNSSIENKIKQINDAIERGIAHESKLVFPATEVPSFASVKNRHILNNLGNISFRYCEIGLHKAGTFVSAVFENGVEAIGIDDWSEFNNGGDTKDICLENAKQFIKCHYEIIDKDFFEMTPEELPTNVDLYFYDGSHNYNSQKRAITHFYQSLSDEAVIVVDDYKWETVRTGTQDGIKAMGFEILYERELVSEKDGDNEGFWNGLYIALLKKAS